MPDYPWPMSLPVYEQYLLVLNQLAVLDPDLHPEEHGALVEQLCSLPGFPLDADPDHDTLVPVLSKKEFSYVRALTR